MDNAPLSHASKGSLARRMTVRLGLAGLALVLAATALLVLVDYHLVKLRVMERFEQIERSYLASVVEDVWLQDSDRLAVLVRGLRQLPYMELVEVVDDTGAVLASSGAREGGDSIVQTYGLSRPYLGQERKLGRMEVWVSVAAMRRPVLERAWAILAVNLAIVAGLLVSFYGILRPLVTEPLGRMAAYARSLGQTDLTAIPPDPDQEVQGPADEFRDLALAFSDMRQAIRSSYLALQESEERHRMLFTASPVSLWEQDFSGVKPQHHRFNRRIVARWGKAEISPRPGGRIIGAERQQGHTDGFDQLLRGLAGAAKRPFRVQGRGQHLGIAAFGPRIDDLELRRLQPALADHGFQYAGADKGGIGGSVHGGLDR